MKTRPIGVLCILLSSLIFVLWGASIERNSEVGLTDFRAVYYGARCILQHQDPYIESNLVRVYLDEGGRFPSDSKTLRLFRRAMPICINLPTSLSFVAILAILPWGPAHVLWMVLIGVSLIVASYLIWDYSARFSSYSALFLVCFMLSNNVILMASGNLAGVAVSLCVIAVWTLLNQRFVTVGIACMAISLLLKPHDSGFIWLFFLLSGGTYRRRALQSVLLAALLALPAILWVSHIAPNWPQELHSNLVATSAQGDLNDPGPTSMSRKSAEMIIALQSAISVFVDKPSVYNPITYLVIGSLLLVWSAKILSSRVTQSGTWFALASVSALTMLLTYHRPYDAKLLLLTVPAGAILWAEGGRLGWMALILNFLGITLTSDIPLASLVQIVDNLHNSGPGLLRDISVVLLSLPGPLVLLAVGAFYLWVFISHSSALQPSSMEHDFAAVSPMSCVLELTEDGSFSNVGCPKREDLQVKYRSFVF